MKHISLLIIFTILLSHPLTVFGISENPDLSPLPSPEMTIPITEFLSPEPTPIQDSTTPSPEAAPTVSIPSTHEVELSPSISPKEEDISVTPELAEQTVHEATSSSELTNREVTSSESTASASVIETGNSENNVSVDNIVNTTITGNNNCVLILSHNFDTQDILDLTDRCQDIMITTESPSDRETYNVNDAYFQTTIQAIADTGKNVLVVPDGIIRTGDSEVQVDLFNLINTNIAGDNTLFGVINLFDSHHGNIILPYELDYILQKSGSSFFPVTSSITHDQYADVLTEIDAAATTGDNTGASVIKTGNGTTTIRLYDKVNTSIIGSNFLILEINTFGTWDGKLLGWEGDIFTKDNQTIAMYKGLTSSEPLHESIQNNNSATVQNTIQIISNTGGNIASSGAEITTGDANATVNVFDFVNTSISGNNWYHVVVNIFDSFKGNIIFPRPDLSVETNADKNIVKEGDIIRFETQFSNNGILFARDTFLETILPNDLEFLDASHGGISSEGIIRWDLGKLLAKEIGSVWFRTKATKVSDSVSVKTTIKTSTDEPQQSDNTSILSLVIYFLNHSETAANNEILPNEYITHQKVQLNNKPEYTQIYDKYQPMDSVKITVPFVSGKGDIRGGYTAQPVNKAQTATPSLFLILYLTGSAVVLLKDWLEN